MRYRFGEFVLDEGRIELRRGPDAVHVEPQVFDVLAYLVRNRDRLVTKEELLDDVWGTRFVTESTLTSRIKAARRAIGDRGSTQELIRTVRGRGFRFVASVEVEPGGAEPADGARPAGRPAALVASRGRLYGRTDDLAAVGRLLAANRAVTISGPGGAGKSTLALAIARRRLEEGTDVVFAELAPARDRDTLVRAVAETAGVEGPGAGDITALAANLGSRELLLVLDNCEHLLDASAELVDGVLDAGPAARVLLTSREPLRIDGEVVHPLGSLGRDAAALFVDRAEAATGAATVDAGDPRVIELCERLDGLPLAIELAAAQLRHLTLDDLAARLDDRLRILVGGRPRAGERHSALAATVEWSYNLLSPASRDVFDRLGVFPAGFDLAAAAAVNPGLDDAAVTGAIADLVAKSLVVHDRGRGRYHLLETIRLFAAGRLAAAGGTADATERLRLHVVARTAALPRSRRWLSGSLAAASRDDIENVRLAFDASVERGALVDAVDVALGISALWRNAVSCSEGLRWAGTLASRERDLAPAERLWLRIVEADLGLGSGNPRLMLDSAARALELAEEVDEPAGAIIATVYRWLVISHRGAVAGLDAARDAARAAGAAQLERLSSAFLAVARLVAGDRAGLEAELERVYASGAGHDYDNYISIWAAWVNALANRDGGELRRWMDVQLENVRASGLQENWVTMFCHALTMIGEGADYLPQLRRARRRAEAEGRRADADCVFALGYAAACEDELLPAAELIGASGGELFHDTANYVHHIVVRDLVVRPRLEGGAFERAAERGRGRPVDAILSEHGL